jgi:hypothetical protein
MDYLINGFAIFGALGLLYLVALALGFKKAFHAIVSFPFIAVYALMMSGPFAVAWAIAAFFIGLFCGLFLRHH